jgi:hypothetical protein
MRFFCSMFLTSFLGLGRFRPFPHLPAGPPRRCGASTTTRQLTIRSAYLSRARASALIIAIVAFGMPVAKAASAALFGAVYGLFPIGWIILRNQKRKGSWRTQGGFYFR